MYIGETRDQTITFFSLQVYIGETRDAELTFYAGDLEVDTSSDFPLLAVIGGCVAGGILVIAAIVVVAMWC